MSDARKRKLQASLTKTTELPESLKFVPSSEPPTNGPHVKKQKTASNSAVALPATKHEGHLLNLQADQVLRVLRRKGLQDEGLTKLVASIQKAIEAIPSASPLKLPELQKLARKSKITIPFMTLPPEDLQLNFEYVSPKSITVVGISALDMQSHTNDNVSEIVVELPVAILQEKDYSNHRVHYKMAFYLFTIARSMKTKYELQYSQSGLFGIQAMSLLVKYKDRQVVIRPSLPQGFFDESKLAANKNADRSIELAIPTPLYNASVLLHIRLASFHAILQNTTTNAPSFADSVLLAHKYFSKRRLAIRVDQWALVTASLLAGGGKNGGKILSPNASALQLFRGTVLFLSQFFSTSDGHDSFGDAQPTPGCWIRNFNIFASLTDQEKLCCANELAHVVTLLSDDEKDAVKAFASVFLEDQNYIGFWDLEFHISDSACQTADIERLWRTLRKALGERASLISVTRPSVSSPEHVSKSISSTRSTTICVCVRLRRPECQATMILGPAANVPEAKSFRGFWGQLAELRKFKDGRILESISLSATNPSLDICQKILALHFPELPGFASWSVYGADSGDDYKLVVAQKTAAADFEEFARLARDLDNLPLRITSISSNESVISTCALSNTNKLDGLIHFESSARWPDDLEAIQRTKVAMLLAMRKPFATIPNVVGVDVILDAETSTMLNQGPGKSLKNIGALSVSLDSGIKYILRISFDRERTLLNTFLKTVRAKSDSFDQARYQEALNAYEQRYVYEETHAQYLRNAISEYPALAETIILLKRWFAKHLLSNHFTERIVELLALSTFVSEYELSSQSPMSAFYKIVRFLAGWDWRMDPLILSGDKELCKANKQEFEKLKERDPAHSLLIYAPYAAKVLTVEKVAALRMTSLMKSMHDRLQDGDGLESTFATPLNHFDLIVYTLEDKRQSKYKNIAPASSQMREMKQLFFRELEEIYEQSLCLFSSPESSLIGIMIDPALQISRRFKPNLGYTTKPTKGDQGLQVVLDLDAIITEIGRLGEGLIQKIEAKDGRKAKT